MEFESPHNFESLLFDKSFRRWIFLKGTEEEVIFWNTYENKNAENSELCNGAKAILFAINLSGLYLSDHEIDFEVRKVLLKSQSPETNSKKSIFSNLLQSTPKKRTFYFALCFLAFLLIAFLNYITTPKNNIDNIYSRLILSDKKNVVKYVSLKDSTTFTLPDGTKVILSKNSSLNFFYRADNGYLKREVILSGEAFFDVTKNSKQPFIVYTSKLTTKVLGTSFKIKSYPDTKYASVQLITGKLSVYKNEDLGNTFTNPTNWGGVLLVPNQEVTFNDVGNTLTKSLIANPVVVSKENDTFVFSKTPVSSVFDTLSKSYNINIIYDENFFNNCTLTVNLGGESFFQKVQVICKSTQSHYEMIDGNIVILKDYIPHF